VIFVKEVFRAGVTYITMHRAAARRSHLSAHNAEKDSFPLLTTKFTSDLTLVILYDTLLRNRIFNELFSRQKAVRVCLLQQGFFSERKAA
jgi:hypothetical protein